MSNQQPQHDLLLEAHRLSVALEDKLLLCGISFTLPWRGIHALIGPQGAGKTTLLRLLSRQQTRLELRSTGEVAYRGPGESPGLLHTPKSISLRTVGDYLGEVIPGTEGSSPMQRRRLLCQRLEYYEVFELLEQLDTRALLLQKPQRSLLALLRALLRDPALLCLDDPTAKLSGEARERCLVVLERAGEERAILLASSDLPAVRRCADEIILLAEGQIQERSKASAFFRKPRSTWGERLLREANIETSISERSFRNQGVDRGAMDDIPTRPSPQVAAEARATEENWSQIPTRDVYKVKTRPRRKKKGAVGSTRRYGVFEMMAAQIGEPPAETNLPIQEPGASGPGPDTVAQDPLSPRDLPDDLQIPEGFTWLIAGRLGAYQQSRRSELANTRLSLDPLDPGLIISTSHPAPSAGEPTMIDIDSLHFSPSSGQDSPDHGQIADICKRVVEVLRSDQCVVTLHEGDDRRALLVLCAVLIWEGLGADEALSRARDSGLEVGQLEVSLRGFERWKLLEELSEPRP